MAITKVMRVSFDMKVVCPSESESELTEYMVELAKKRMAGEKLSGLGAVLLEESLKTGPEGALTICIKSGMGKAIKELASQETGLNVTASNVRFEVKR